MELRDALFAALRYELTGSLPEAVSFDALDEPFLKELYDYANRQEVAHLVGDALDRLGVLDRVSDEMAELYRRRMAVAAYHAEQQRQVFEVVSEAFEGAKIPYLPLKGLVIRPLYPEPWMRTAGDLDILVKQEDLGRAEHALLEIGAKKEKEGPHDIAFFFPTGVMLELHYRLLTSESANGAREVLDEIWEHTELVAEDRFAYRMKDAWFYYYHLVHAAKHLEDGSCGTRPFLDLWFLNHKVFFNAAAREEVLKQNNLLQFAKVAEAISEVWLSGKDSDEWTRSLENFLLMGGVFGGSATKYSIETNKKGGKLGLYLSRVFLPFEVMKKRAPVLERHPWLFPFLQVTRWFSFLFCGGVRRNRNTTKEVKRMEREHTTKELLNHLGLQKK